MTMEWLGKRSHSIVVFTPCVKSEEVSPKKFLNLQKIQKFKTMKLYRYIVLALLLIAGLGLPLNSKVLSPEEALGLISQYKSIPDYLRTLIANNTFTPLLTWKDGQGQPAMYLLAPGEGVNGFILAAADDKACVLIGYGDDNPKSALRKDSTSLEWFKNSEILREYSDQIAWGRKNGFGEDSQPTFPAGQVAPLTHTKWNQRSPFNDLCPEIGDKHCLTGCGPTAFSQLLKYYSWPPQGTGSKSYTPPAVGKVIGMNFANTTFRWNEMLDAYEEDSPQEAKTAVATLMLATGISVETDYNVNESSSSINSIGAALSNYFRYQNGIWIADRKYYLLSEWSNLLCNELRNRRPIIYSVPKHLCVVDGYRDGYFHYNWGWGGFFDGFFIPSAILTDDARYMAFLQKYDHSVLAGVCPDDGNHTVNDAPYFQVKNFKLPQQTIMVGSTLKVDGSFYNGMDRDMTVTFGLGLEDKDGKLRILPALKPREVQRGHGAVEFYLTVPHYQNPGVYSVTPVVKASDGQWYKMQLDIQSRQPQYLVIGDWRARTFSDAWAAESYFGTLNNANEWNQSPDSPFMWAENFVLPSSFNLNDNLKVDGKFHNGVKRSIYITMGLKIVDEAGNAYFLGDPDIRELQENYSYEYYYVNHPGAIPEGTYIATPAFKDQDGYVYDIPVQNENAGPYRMRVSGMTAEFSR